MSFSDHARVYNFIQGWTKPNTFHICITSYNIVVQDHRAFKQKRWKYLVLDEVSPLLMLICVCIL